MIAAAQPKPQYSLRIIGGKAHRVLLTQPPHLHTGTLPAPATDDSARELLNAQHERRAEINARLSVRGRR